MSSAVVSTSAAPGRPFIFDADAGPEVGSLSAGLKKPAQASAPESVIATVFQSKIGNRQSTIPLTPASRLEIRSAPEMVSSGIPALDALTGGLPRGCLAEICGPASSGRTTVLLASLAAASSRGEYCVLIDASDALDPHSLAVAGVDLDRLLWVRCGETSPQAHPSTVLRAGSGTEKNTFKVNSEGWLESQNGKHQSERRLEQVLRATDLLLESGGFGLIILDLADVPPQSARRIPLTTWFRFRRAVEHKPTILLVIEQQPIAGSCSSLLLQLGAQSDEKKASMQTNNLSGDGESTAKRREPFIVDFQIAHPAHARLLTGLNINAEIIRSRLDRKPSQSVTFATKTAWPDER
jgi:hypothetical protein